MTMCSFLGELGRRDLGSRLPLVRMLVLGRLSLALPLSVRCLCARGWGFSIYGIPAAPPAAQLCVLCVVPLYGIGKLYYPLA